MEPLDSQQAELDQIALKMFAFKNAQMKAAIYLILERALKHSTFWPDEISFDVIAKEDSNCIGQAFRMLSHNLGLIKKTGRFRRSETKASKGRTVFEYGIENRRVAHTLLFRLNRKRVMEQSQPELGLFQ
jgi:hypothetical protein